MSATHRARGVPIDPAWRSQVLAAGSSKTFRPRLKGWGGAQFWYPMPGTKVHPDALGHPGRGVGETKAPQDRPHGYIVTAHLFEISFSRIYSYQAPGLWVPLTLPLSRELPKPLGEAGSYKSCSCSVLLNSSAQTSFHTVNETA